MANIDQYIEQIENARYGKDVRQAIVDALSAMNSEIMGSGVVNFNGRNGEVVPVVGDYDISQITADNAHLNQVPFVNTNGTFTMRDIGDGGVLSGLSDVSIDNPSDGQILKYNGTEWENADNSSGVSDYSDLDNKPQINGVTLNGNKTSSQLGLINRQLIASVYSDGVMTYGEMLSQLYSTARVNTDFTNFDNDYEIEYVRQPAHANTEIVPDSFTNRFLFRENERYLNQGELYYLKFALSGYQSDIGEMKLRIGSSVKFENCSISLDDQNDTIDHVFFNDDVSDVPYEWNVGHVGDTYGTAAGFRLYEVRR